MQRQLGAYFNLCVCAEMSVRVSVYPPVSLCVSACVCGTSQQEQPKCVPLMSSCGRPPAKSQRLALLYTPPSMSPFLPPLFTFSCNPHHPPSPCLSFFIICPCLLISVLSLLSVSIHHLYLGLVLKVTKSLIERRRGIDDHKD